MAQFAWNAALQPLGRTSKSLILLALS